MNKLLIAILSLSLMISSCKKDPERASTTATTTTSSTSTTATTSTTSTTSTTAASEVKLLISNEVDGMPVKSGSMDFTNAKGNKYSFTVMRYYISQLTLTYKDGKKQTWNKSFLVDALESQNFAINLGKLENYGEITNISFGVGVDSLHNHTGAQEGDLDPSKGMLWTWKTGYIFYKHEGSYSELAGGAVKPLRLHLGTDITYTKINIDAKSTNITAANSEIHITFNVNSVYSSPNVIDFTMDYDRQSTKAEDQAWMMKMKNNLGDAFEFKQIK
jgi:hypothetical protein